MNEVFNILVYIFACIGVSSVVVTIMFLFLYIAWSKSEEERAAEREEEAAERQESECTQY